MFLLVLLHSFGLKIGGYAHFSVSTIGIKKLVAKKGNPKNFFPYEMALHFIIDFHCLKLAQTYRNKGL